MGSTLAVIGVIIAIVVVAIVVRNAFGKDSSRFDIDE